MFTFFKKLRGWFSKEPDISSSMETSQNIIIPDEKIPEVKEDNPVVEITQPVVEDEPIGAYVHLNRRLFKRYQGMHITWDTFKEWNRKITNNEAIFIEDRHDGKLYCIRHNGRPVFLVYNRDAIITALPAKVDFLQALKKIEAPDSERLKAHNAELAKKVAQLRKQKKPSRSNNQVDRKARIEEAIQKNKTPLEPRLKVGKTKASKIGVNLDKK